MKATFVLLADLPAENLGRKLMYRAHKLGGMGFEMARLPHHISLKQPFEIECIEAVEAYFDDFAAGLKPVEATFNELVLWPSNVFGYESGVLVVGVEKTKELYDLHRRLNRELQERFGSCPAAFDGDAYSFHMTIAIGGAPYANYEKTYCQMRKQAFQSIYTFSELGFLIYEENAIIPGTYFCYKRARL